MSPHKKEKTGKQIADQGFTLVEVLIAMAIFAIGILGVASMQITSINGNASSRMHTEATTLAVERLERLIALPYDHADLDELNNPHQVIDGNYTIVWNVSDDIPINATKTINITVTGANRNARRIAINFIRGQG